MADVNTAANEEINMEENMNELKKLKQRLNHESIRHQFRTKVVGGLNEEDVTKYIEDLEGKFKQLEKNYKKATDDIYIIRNKLNMELEEKYKLEEDIKEMEQELSVYKYECKQKDMTINSLSEQSNSENEILKSQARQFAQEKTEIERQLEELNIKYEQSKEYVAKLEEENNGVAAIQEENRKMADEIEAFEELLNQSSIELEHLRMSAEESEKENTVMKAKIIDLENKLSAKDYKINEINRVCQDLKQELEIEKSCGEKLNMDLVIFKQKIVSLEETINEKLEELDEQTKSKEKIEQELAMEKSKVLSYRINGFKEEFEEMYKKIEKLEEEANESIQSSTYLQQQLAIHQNRADKAESDLASFIKLLSGAKDKFYNDRNPFGDQFTQLVETENWE
jgi:DNA repair exonuclease SbcCD ATPase subunit